jgi:ATP-dependent DNA helicase RecQ
MSLEPLKKLIAQKWGFPTLRPLQEQAMQAVLDGRDSLVVLPTGGGKSLCYQAPAVFRNETTIVVSPLISLMKDQVDSLRANGIPAAMMNSGQSSDANFGAEMEVRTGQVRLLFVAPERLVTPGFQTLLRQIGLRTLAIDEAHCISHWGHDFRPEYRQLQKLRQQLPDASIHAYTATATERVRRDIIEQLGLRNPAVMVGSFDRPNLTYRVLPRLDEMKQVLEVVQRHKGEAGIIYCLRRKDVDELAAALIQHGHQARPYHAGMEPDQRHEVQEDFKNEGCDLVVATVAFGMGIDRSNVRFVLHTGMPKSVEHYQQEAGRAGRDGLPAECVLLYSYADTKFWEFMLQKTAAEPGVDASFLENALAHVTDVSRFCGGAVCRHKALVNYFNQEYELESCAACDLCLGDAELVADAGVVAQKILSCVARVKESYGTGHVIAVLRGQVDEKVQRLKHDQLTTFGLLKDRRAAELRSFIYQLIGQGVLEQSGGEYPILKLNAAAWEVMKGQRSIRLVQTVRRKKGEAARASKADAASWEGVDRDLFETLRGLRRQIATERQVPPYLVFSDDTLRELARVRPSSPETMRRIHGIGDAKLKDFGPRFLPVIAEHCQQQSMETDCGLAVEPAPAEMFTPPTTPQAAVEEQRWWDGVDRPLFRALRQLQGELAEERQAPPQSILADLTLRDLARVRPSSSDRMLPLYGINATKLSDFGERFLALIREHCRQHMLTTDNALGAMRPPKPRSDTPKATTERAQAYELFRQQLSVESVVQRTGWGKAKVAAYLSDYIGDEKPASIAAWVADDVCQRVAAVVRRLGTERLKPIYVALGEQVSYEDIRLVIAHVGCEVEPSSKS